MALQNVYNFRWDWNPESGTLIFGGAERTRTAESRFCRPLP
jgi:hypothetical protein